MPGAAEDPEIAHTLTSFGSPAQDAERRLQQQRLQALIRCVFSVANYGLLYVTAILLARTLSVPDFDDYNVAVSSVLVLTALATLGLEKLGSLVLTMLAQTGVIILELNHPDEAVVSAYAVAFQTEIFVVILATATNRLYTPRISALLDRGDFQALRTMARYRLLVIAPLTLGYLFVILAFGPSILSLFGEKYSTEYPALCLVALGASISTLFSLSPTYMHFTNRDRIVLAALVASVVLNLALCIPLSDRYGALGAAIAYAVPISLLHVGLWLFELYDLVRYKLAMWHARFPGLTR